MREDEVQIQPTTAPWAPSRVRRVSWGAIFAGLFVTIALQLMLTLLGAAVGAATVNPMQEQNPLKGLGTASGIWLLVTSLISIWIGSCVAGRLSGGPRRTDGLLHGVVTWSVSTLAMVMLLATTLGALLGGTGALLSNAIPQGTQNTPAAASLTDQIKGMFPQAGALLPPTGRTDGQQVPGELTSLAQQDSELAAAMARMEKNGGASRATQARDQVVQILTSKHNMDQAQATSLVNQWDQQFQQVQRQVEQKTRQAGDVAARGISQGALVGFIALLLGIAVAAWGGWVGTASLPRVEPTATVVT